MITSISKSNLESIDEMLDEILKRIGSKSVLNRMSTRFQNEQGKIFLKVVNEWFESFQKQISNDLQKKFLKASGIDITTKLTDWKFIEKNGVSTLKPAFLSIMGKAGDKSFRIAGIEGSFDVYNVHSVELADKLVAKLVTEVTDETKKGIAHLIGEGIKDGKSMPKVAKELRAMGIGLNSKQAKAAVNYERYLKEKRPDLSSFQIRKKIDRYAKKQLRYRTNMIARTETARAQSEGTLEGYSQVGIEEAEFLASAGACPICADLNGNRYSIADARAMIPVHPNGRCTWISVGRIKRKVPKVPEFVPAKTIEEAEEFAKHNLAEYVNYKSLSVKSANVINETWYELAKQGKRKIGAIGTKKYVDKELALQIKVKRFMMGVGRPRGGYLIYNTDMIKNIKQWETNISFMDKTKLIINATPKETVIHEFGHYLEDIVGEKYYEKYFILPDAQMWSIKQSMKPEALNIIKDKIGSYALSQKSELFAEVYRSYKSGKLPKELNDFKNVIDACEELF